MVANVCKDPINTSKVNHKNEELHCRPGSGYSKKQGDYRRHDRWVIERL